MRYAVDGEVRTVHRAVGAASSFGGAPLLQHIGLGSAERILELEVRWPGGGTSRFDDVALDAHLRLVEGEPTFEIVKAAD